MFAISMLSIFIGIAVFGFFRMDMSGHNNCIASMMNPNALCPNSNALAVSAFHVEAFRNFLSATFGGASAMLLAFVLFIFAGLFFSAANLIDNENFQLQQVLLSDYPKPSTHRLKFFNWFSIHENSPAFIIRR